MLIQEMTRQQSIDLLAHTRFGRLGCARENQPYVVPFYFGYDANYLYTFSTVGQKIEWMRTNPLVCVEIDEVENAEQWVSVVIFGRYEELPDSPEWQSTRELAYEVLRRKPNWWEPGYAKTILHGTPRPLVPCYYRIRIVQITGHRATPESGKPSETKRLIAGSNYHGWFQRILRQVMDKRDR